MSKTNGLPDYAPLPRDLTLEAWFEALWPETYEEMKGDDYTFLEREIAARIDEAVKKRTEEIVKFIDERRAAMLHDSAADVGQLASEIEQKFGVKP